MITASAPGKLYITGEYAVLETGHPAIIVALDQYITVSLTKQDHRGSITSSYSNFLPIPWTRKDGKVFVDERENPFNYVITAIQMTEKYVESLGKELSFYHLDIQSDLMKKDGRKYGLGSSGAVTVATVKALLKFYGVPLQPLFIYKLCVLTHLEIGSNGSFGDIAASTFGGWIAYSKFDQQWLEKQAKTHSIQELVAMDWKDLRIESLPAPKELELFIGWTGDPASTASLVDQMNQDNEKHRAFHRYFLQTAKKIVEKTIHDFKKQQTKEILEDIAQYRQLLKELAQQANICIETPTLTEFCTIVETFGASGKSSGAGGGDCGIAFLPKSVEKEALIKILQENEIEYLDFHVHGEEK